MYYTCIYNARYYRHACVVINICIQVVHGDAVCVCVDVCVKLSKLIDYALGHHSNDMKLKILLLVYGAELCVHVCICT